MRQNGVVSSIQEPERDVSVMREEWERWGKVIASISGKQTSHKNHVNHH